MQLGPAEILVVLVIALLVFGPHKLPEVGRQVGRAYREVRRFQRSLSTEMHDVFAEDVAAEDLSDGAAPAPTLPPRTDRPDPDEPAADPASEPGPDDRPAEPAAGDEKAER